MKGSPAIYLGRIVEKANFRAFIYAPNGDQRLVESWDEFEANMQSGLWFATIEDAKQSLIVEKPKAKPRPSRAKKEVVAESIDEETPADEVSDDLEAKDLAFEVTDDFLPKG